MKWDSYSGSNHSGGKCTGIHDSDDKSSDGELIWVDAVAVITVT